MKTLTIFCLLAVSPIVWGQTPFIATYNLSGDGNNLTSFSYNGEMYDGIIPQDLVKAGITSTSSTGNFRGSNWPTGATDGSDVFTGSVDLEKYIGFTISAAAGYKFSVTSITFGIGRSATGPRQWQWRGSEDDFNSILTNYISLNADLNNTDGILTTPDVNGSWTNNIIEPGSNYEDITGAAGFRLYGYNSEGTGGTGGLQGNITISGTFELTNNPIITLNTGSFDSSFGSVAVGNSSASSGFTVSGSNLTDNITINPPEGFEIRTGANPFSGDPVVLNQSGGEVTETGIDVRFTPVASGFVSGEITCTSSGAETQNVSVNGTGVLPVPFQVVFEESMGNVSATTQINTHAGANGFDNDELSFSGTADLRSTSQSNGYDGASGGANVFFSGSSGTFFEISGINTTGLMNLQLSFGIFKGATASDGSDFTVEVSSDGITYESLSFDLLPTGTGTASWHYRTANSTIPSAENLHIRFSSAAALSSQYRLDDVLLRNDAPKPVITAGGSTTLCEGESLLLTSSAGAAYLWSTGETTQSIEVSEEGNYSVTVTDAKGTSAASDAVEVFVIPVLAPTGSISGLTNVSAGQTGVEYSVSEVTGASEYLWTVPADANIASGQGTNSITVDWGNTSGDVTVTPSNICFTGTTVSLAVIVSTTVAAGSVSGTVSVDGNGLAGVLVKLLNDEGEPVDNVNDQITNSQGQYGFSDLDPGEYQLMIVEPLGYAVDENPKSTNLEPGGNNTVDFSLSEVVIVNDARGIGYWKHQFDVYVTNRGNARESAENLQNYINTIHQNYTPHFDIFEDVNSFSDWQSVLSVKGNQPALERAKQHLAALLFNFASLKIGQYLVVTDDNRTAGDALTFISQLTADGNTENDGLAKDLAETINSQQNISAGIIPPGSILYKNNNGNITWGFETPESYNLSQNYPNPFNPETVIRFQIAEPGYVEIKVFNLAGQEVATLFNESREPGYYSVKWNAGNLASGLYIYRIISGNYIQSRKMLLIK
jgi:hypothetical protein